MLSPPICSPQPSRLRAPDGPRVAYPSAGRALLRPALADAVILPAAVAVERTGIPLDKLLEVWNVQTLTRRYPDGSEEQAVRVPTSLLDTPLHAGR